MSGQRVAAFFLLIGAVITLTSGLSLRKKRQAGFNNWGYGPSTYSPTPAYTHQNWGRAPANHWGSHPTTPSPWSHAPQPQPKPKPSFAPQPAAPAVHTPISPSMLQGMSGVRWRTSPMLLQSTQMMQAALQLKWANPIYQSQAHRAGDAFTFNPSPTRNGYKGQKCPPGIKQETCLYNPCPRCRDSFRIVCWTNPCGGCSAELYSTLGQRIYDCETI